MNSLHQYIQQGIRLSNDTVAIESLATALSINPSGANSRANTLINVATESFCNRWGIPRVVIATESFQTSAAKQASIVACEGVKEMVANAWRKFIEWLNGLVAKFKAAFNHFRMRGKSLSEKADHLEKLIAKAGDLKETELKGAWGKLTIDGVTSYQKPCAFLNNIHADAATFAKSTTAFINLSLDGKSTIYDVSWRGLISMHSRQIEGMNKPQIIAMPNNALLIIGMKDRKPVVEVRPGEDSKGSIKSGNKAALDTCLKAIDAGIAFLENRSNEFNEFISTIERLTKLDKLPFENHSGDKLDEDDIKYYMSRARAGVIAGSVFIQHIDRFVDTAVTGLLEYGFASVGSIGSSHEGKDYGITPAFTNAVDKNSVKDIRIMMKDSLLVDLTFEQFDEMARLAKDVKGLYQEHKDGGHFDPLDLDVSKWDDDYMNGLMVDVVDNFSHERLNHLKKVVRKLRPPKDT